MKPKRITEKYLYNAAIAYLERFPTTVSHFRMHFVRKIEDSLCAYPDQDRQLCHQLLNELIDKLCKMNILNDELYLENKIRSLRKKGHSARSIQSKLQQKGLVTNTIQSELEQTESSDLEAAITWIKRKRLIKNEPIKIMNTLARAGFNYETSKKAIESSLQMILK
ncbi:MAG: RecX family transcriptional regulator [Chlamydiales bacterium]|nr:RecX family transcriptional regulator [Chlamydiales bacterium]